MRPGRVLVIGLVILAATGAVACSTTRVGGRGGPQSKRAVVGSTGRRPESLGCASAVSSPGQTWPNRWPRPVDEAVAAGPIAWPDALDLASDPGPRSTAAAYAPYHGLSLIVDDLVAVNDGAVVQVRIPASERTRLSLDYLGLSPRTAAGRYAVADGASQVTFHSCSPGSTDGPSSRFDGGFIVAGAQCALVDVYTGDGRQPLVRRIPFGVPAGVCRSDPR
ncbi:MAG TPA: hypothetical protein VIJ51_10730 [Solirubrobacteraceae bacterium]